MEKIIRQPLLYIQQPSFKVPQVNMQVHYSVKRNRREHKEGVELDRKEVQSTMEEYDQNRHSPLKRLKPFKEMDLEEKIEYLQNFPKSIPPVPCIFQTANEAVRGIFVNKTENEVIVKQFDQTEKSISIKDLTSIVMMGLN